MLPWLDKKKIVSTSVAKRQKDGSIKDEEPKKKLKIPKVKKKKEKK